MKRTPSMPDSRIMIWVAWKNRAQFGPSSSGLGLKVPFSDREVMFDRTWSSVVVELPTGCGYVRVNVSVNKESFWSRQCGELISKDIGEWLRASNLVPWSKGKPPRFHVVRRADRHFRVLSQQ